MNSQKRNFLIGNRGSMSKNMRGGSDLHNNDAIKIESQLVGTPEYKNGMSVKNKQGNFFS
jgi:hypothetical protein